MPTKPRSKNVEPGESEFSWGKGLQAPESRGYEPTNFDQMKALQRSDSADESAVIDPTAAPNTSGNTTETQWVREQ